MDNNSYTPASWFIKSSHRSHPVRSSSDGIVQSGWALLASFCLFRKEDDIRVVGISMLYARGSVNFSGIADDELVAGADGTV